MSRNNRDKHKQCVVLSSLHAASHREGHGLPAEIGLLSWVAFFGNALLVLLQLAKPELDDTESVYVRVLDRGTVIHAGTGWQAFWTGGDSGCNAFDADGPLILGRRGRDRGCFGCLLRWCCSCFGWTTARDGDEALEGGGEAWPIVGVEAGASVGSLNESLLGSVGLENSLRSGVSASKTKRGRSWTARRNRADGPRTGRCFGRINRRMSSMFDGTDKAMRESRDGLSEAGFQQYYFQSNLAGASPLAVGRGTTPGLHQSHERLFVSPSYSVPFASRPPPQAAVPVFGVSVTRWRLVDTERLSTVYGSPSDVVSIDRGPTELLGKVSSSSHKPDALSTDPAGVDSCSGASKDDEAKSPAAAMTLQLELAVRSSGRGEMDWWGCDSGSEPTATSGRGFATVARGGGSGRSALASTASDWRVWRSAAEVLALYDALALRFGSEFFGRVPRPQLRTVTKIAIAPPPSGDVDDKGSRSASAMSSTPIAASPHRADFQRDARTVGAFLRGLLGLRQFLSTAVMDFLRPPPWVSLEVPRVMLTGREGDEDEDVDGKSWDGSDSGSLDFEENRAPQEENNAAGGGASLNFFPSCKAESSCTGEAVAGAALASDYGAWLKRLAVRMRRAAPAGDRFIRLRRISHAVTGDEVVQWLVASSGECRGDRASAVRLGQDMVSNRLLVPLCAGYGGSGDTSTSSSRERQQQRDLLRSFDDGVGWLFAYAGEALRDPFTPPPPTEVAVMKGSCLRVGVTKWIETSDDEGPHACFVVHVEVEVTREAWDIPRRYRDFTQLRKRLLRLGIDLSKATAARGGRSGGDGSRVGSLEPDLPKKTWRANKFDKNHLDARRAALEAYMEAAVGAALATPHLAGYLLMRFLDPDEANLRLLCDRNPFASWSPLSRASEEEGRGASGTSTSAEEAAEGPSVTREAEQEEEDFQSLTDSLGGVG